jgi:hypothetical protein
MVDDTTVHVLWSQVAIKRHLRHGDITSISPEVKRQQSELAAPACRWSSWPGRHAAKSGFFSTDPAQVLRGCDDYVLTSDDALC